MRADILQLIAESKSLKKMGFHLPEAAHLVMLQEARFKTYFDELTHMLKLYTGIVSKIPPVLAAAMDPLIRDLELRMVRNCLLLKSLHVWSCLCFCASMFSLLTQVCASSRRPDAFA